MAYEFTEITSPLTMDRWIEEVNTRFKEILGYDGDTPPATLQTIQELRAELLALIASSAAICDQAGFYVGKPDAGKKLFSIRTTRAFTLPANCEGSRAGCAVAPHASATFTIKKNGFQVGTFTIAAGVLTATFASDETDFAIGDVLTIWAPATADADMEDPDWNIKINADID